MKTLLVVVSWLAGGPSLATHEFATAAACAAARDHAVEMIEQQAAGNLTGPHRPERGPGAVDGETVLRTAIVGREIARLRCVDPGPRPPAAR